MIEKKWLMKGRSYTRAQFEEEIASLCCHWWRVNPPPGLRFLVPVKKDDPKQYTFEIVGDRGAAWKQHEEQAAYQYELARRSEIFGDPEKIVPNDTTAYKRLL